MKIVDFRCRPCTKEWLEWLHLPFQKLHVSRAKALHGGEFKLQTVEDLIQEMDGAGVSIGVVMGRDVETTLGWKWHNENVAQIAKQYPDRLIGYAGVDPNKGMEAVREVGRAVKLGLKGVSIDPFLSKTRINDKKLYPIYAKCVENGFPVILTTGMSTWGGDWAYMKFCTTMDIDEVATDFPELTIICTHAGFPWVWEMLSIAMRHPNVIMETSGIWTLYKAFKATEPYCEAANTVLGDQFVFGSAKPYGPIKGSIEAHQNAPLKEEVLKKIFYDNAAHILKI